MRTRFAVTKVSALIALTLAIAVAVGSGSAQAQAVGDAKRGEDAYARLCAGCHAIDENRIGPKHRGVVGRRVGSVDGFNYSDALKRSKLTWDAALLDRWLADPEVAIPGQRMGFRVNAPENRNEIIIYLLKQVAKN